eukprot:jgi/Ulvmu1/3798/UM018_0008.1
MCCSGEHGLGEGLQNDGTISMMAWSAPVHCGAWQPQLWPRGQWSICSQNCLRCSRAVRVPHGGRVPQADEQAARCCPGGSVTASALPRCDTCLQRIGTGEAVAVCIVVEHGVGRLTVCSVLLLFIATHPLAGCTQSALP